MDKYLVKPTQLIGENGYVYDTNSLDQTPAIQELAKKVDNATFLNTTAIQEVRDRVYQMEIVNGAVNDRIKAAEEVSAEAKTAANAAHTYASGLFERVTTAESTAYKAQEKALESYNSLHSLNGDIESLKSRVEDLEEIGGQGGADLVVGKSKMGYVPDFTEYGLNDQKYVYLEWGSEGRSLTFSSDTPLGNVLEEIIYYTGTAITSNHNRITALENGTSGGSSGGTSSGTTCNCPSDVGSRLTALENKPSCSCPSDVETRLSALESNPVDLTQINNTLTSHTNSIQSLDTRTGSHTASIGQLENRMTDVEVQASSNKTTITSMDEELDLLKTSISITRDQFDDLKTRVETLETDDSSCNCPSDVETRLTTLESKPTCSCPSDVESRLSALENNSGGSNGSSCSCVDRTEDFTKINNKLSAIQYNFNNVFGTLRLCFESLYADPLFKLNIETQTLDLIFRSMNAMYIACDDLNNAFTNNS